MEYWNRNEIYRLTVRIFFLGVSLTYLSTDDVHTRGISLYSTILCFVLILLAYFEKKRIVSEYTIILAFFILFHFGQIIVYTFDSMQYLPVYNDFSNEYVIKAIGYSLLCLQVFDLTFFLYRPIMESKIKDNVASSQSYLSAADIVSKISLIILTPIVFINLLAKTMFSLKYGYMNLYAYDGVGYTESAIIPYLQNLFVIMCILRITSVSFDKEKSKAPLLLILIYSLLMFAGGSRSGMLSVLLPALMIYCTKIKKGEKEKKGKIIILAIILIVGSVFMSYFRLITNKTSSGVEESINYVTAYNPVSTIMVEMGGTLKPVIYCTQIFNGAENFKIGASYLASILILIPTIGKVLGPVHPAAKLANLSQWLMEYKHLSHGPGFSIVAESYYNFGNWGCMVFIVWSIILCKILGNPNKQNEERNFISYATMTLVFALIRGSTSDFIRVFVYEVILLNVILKIIAGTVFKKYN